MPQNLKNEAAIWRLASDLGLKPVGDPIEAIVAYCVKRIRGIVRRFPCATPAELLELMAIQLDTLFIEIDSDEKLRSVKDEYCRRGELSFADLEDQLSPNVYAITFGLVSPANGDRKFVSLIDCRGAKRQRSYFSKWHELAHLLTLTPQMRLRFCRTHVLPETKDPEESLMDVVAGEFAFFADLVTKYAIGPISFQRVEDLRVRLCPEASAQSALIGLTQAWPRPCILIRAELGMRKDERMGMDQGRLGFREQPVAVLRAVRATPNDAARAVGFSIPPNMRVPEESVIQRVFREGGSSVSDEELDWWVSRGRALRRQPIRVEARFRGAGVEVLVTMREVAI